MVRSPVDSGLLSRAETDSAEPLCVPGVCVLQLRHGAVGVSHEADADQADCEVRHDGDALVESRECGDGGDGIWVLGAGDAVSDVYRGEYGVAVVFQPVEAESFEERGRRNEEGELF